jgi:hypothetical protein
MHWSRTGALLSVGWLWASFPGVGEARTWHVRPDGTGDAGTIQAAVDSARAGDDVLLAAGTYTWTTESASGESMLHLKPGIWLHSESGAAVTILDAESRGRVIEGDNLQDQVRIQELTIQNGRLEGDDGRGAGIKVTGDSAPHIVDCTIQNNSIGTDPAYGAGVFCDRATVERCLFLGNSAYGIPALGGAVMCGPATFTNCQFSQNSAHASEQDAHGGAIVANSATINSCTFDGNLAESIWQGGAFGGCIDEQGIASISDCTFTGNLADSDGGSWGGAVEISAQGGTITNSIFVRNTVRSFSQGPSEGGGVHSWGACVVRRSLFVGNVALGNHSGLGNGGGILCGAGSRIENCTFFDNAAPENTQDVGGGVGAIGISSGTVVATIIAGTVVSSSGATCSGSAIWSCCDLFGNSAGDAICGIDGGGNFSADPGFCAVDPGSSLNFELRSNSPCAPGQHPPGAESCELIGASPVGCGGTAIKARSWSQVKSFYR